MNPLLVSELFLCILDCLTPPSDADREYGARRAALAALARTCRAFSEPSLDHLWRRLDSLLPLFKCYSGVVGMRICEKQIEAPSTPDEWRIINKYLPRIQELYLDKWNDMYYLRLTHLVLPNLKVFRWAGPFRFDSDSDTFVALLPSLTPNVDTLQVRLSEVGSAKSLSFLRDYSRLYPNLKSIKLFASFPAVESPRFSATLTEPLSRTLCGRADWKQIEISCPIGDIAFKHLATSSTLRVVSLTLLPNAGHEDERFFEPTETPFPNVASLSLTLYHHLDVVTNLLRTRDQAFHSLTIKVQRDQTTAMEVSALLAAIPSSPRIHSLRSLEVEQSCVCSEPFSLDDGPGLSYEAFRPIASLVHLRELAIYLSHPIFIHDHEFAQLVSNWPYLQVLGLAGTNESSAPSLSLTALTSLASCKDLQRISIALDARRVVDDPSARACCPAVTHIKFLHCPIGDPEPVASFLTRHAPQATVRSRIGQLPGIETRWDYVESWKQVEARVNGPERTDGRTAMKTGTYRLLRFA